jgi:hypothetical protein
MLTRKIWIGFILLTILLLGTGYQQIMASIHVTSNQQEIEANQRIAEKIDGNLDALEDHIRLNEIDKAKDVLKLLSKNEHIVCTSLLIGTKTFSYPETCDIKQSDRTIIVGSAAGSVVKVDTGLTLAEELSTKVIQAFLVLLVGFFGVLGLFAILFSMAHRWMEVKGEKPKTGSFFFKAERFLDSTQQNS